MSCCQCQGIENCFDHERAEDELKAYRKKGPSKSTRVLLSAIKGYDLSEATLLDIGGGVGIIQHELMPAGLKEAAHIDASSAYLKASQAEAQRRGYAGRISYQHGNFVELAPSLDPADIVTLDRVICCFDDMPALIQASAQKANRLYALVFPRDVWWIKFGVTIVNVVQRLRRDPFRLFVHSTQAVEAIVQANGFKRTFYKRFFFWQVLVFSK